MLLKSKLLKNVHTSCSWKWFQIKQGQRAAVYIPNNWQAISKSGSLSNNNISIYTHYTLNQFEPTVVLNKMY